MLTAIFLIFAGRCILKYYVQTYGVAPRRRSGSQQKMSGAAEEDAFENAPPLLKTPRRR